MYVVTMKVRIVADYRKIFKEMYMTAEICADMGMVKTQAQRIFPATPQRTAVSRFVVPTPIIAPVIV